MACVFQHKVEKTDEKGCRLNIMVYSFKAVVILDLNQIEYYKQYSNLKFH